MEFKQLPSPPPVKPATRDEVSKFVRGLQKFRSRGEKPMNEKALNDFLARQPLGSLQGIARRIMMDILKAPTADAPDRGKGKKTTPVKQRTLKGRKSAKRSKKATTKRTGASKKKTAGRKAPKKASRKKKQASRKM
jgi:hypothetical protein